METLSRELNVKTEEIYREETQFLLQSCTCQHESFPPVEIDDQYIDLSERMILTI